MKKLRSYAIYSIACTAVWSVILIAFALGFYPQRRTVILYIFCGWAIGWFSATIARAVYPPPKSRWRVDSHSVG